MKQHSHGLILLVCSTLCFSGCGYAGPEKAVRKELDYIQKLDETAISSFISYEDLSAASDLSLEEDSDTTDAFRLFFQNFKYHIDSSSQSEDGTSATVTVSLTNLDACELAKDLCREIRILSATVILIMIYILLSPL